MTEKLQKKHSDTDIFLATLTHELRTPLSVILTWLQILEMNPHDSKTMQVALQAIKDSVNIQNKLIEDLANISKIKLQKFSLQLKPQNLTNSLKRAIDAIRPIAEKKSIALIEAASSAHLVNLDEARISQVFANILANAIKFTPKFGKVKISIQNQANQVKVIFKDNGIGIKPKLIPKIFDRFAQADMTHSITYGGLGIGLYLVRHIMDAHHGEVAAHSLGKGRGTTITLTFPLLQ